MLNETDAKLDAYYSVLKMIENEPKDSDVPLPIFIKRLQSKIYAITQTLEQNNVVPFRSEWHHTPWGFIEI